MSCKWAGSDQPRVVSGRHDEDCDGDECAGCQPCTENHCGTCGMTHVGTDLNCAGCIGEARTNLAEIVDRAPRLPHEAVTKGVASEAFHLAGPTANPAAWQQRGRYGHKYAHDARLGENHPLWVLGTWDLAVTQHYGHHRTAAITVDSAADYLGRNLTDLAQDADFAFDALASDLRDCLSHIEAVLHDQAQGDRANVGCFECGRQLERKLVKDGFEDFWTCQGCRRRYTYAEYNFALRASLEDAESA